MEKAQKPAKSTSTSKKSPKDVLEHELEAIANARTKEAEKFKAALEKLYADHRKAAKDLQARRAAAWEKYEQTKKPVEKAEPAEAAEAAAPEAQPKA